MNIETDGFSAMTGPTGNLVRLFHKSTQCDVFHWCDDESELLSHPQYYGVPLIFPPNRTAHGKFCFQGRIYQLPINDPAHDFNVHGFLLDRRPKSVIRENDRWIVQTVWEPGCQGFSGYPHTFELTRISERWTFSPSSFRLTLSAVKVSCRHYRFSQFIWA